MTIIIDNHEKNSLVPSELINENLDVQFEDLKVADYLVNGVAIERKTVSDFISSMISRRLLIQLDSLEQYENRLLLIEGIEEQELYTDSEKKIGMHPNSVRGFLLSIILKHKTPIIFTKNEEDTAKFIAILERRKEKETSLKISKRAKNKNEQKQLILEGFPGIGPKTAKKLLEKFSSIKNILNASEEELKIILGKKTDIFLEMLK